MHQQLKIRDLILFASGKVRITDLRRLAGLRREDLSSEISYTNSAGTPFTGSVADILLHVVLHGQYHRGKINLLLRQSGFEPAPADYIAFVRGAPAATRGDSG